jgi:hypothetical protein
LTEAQIAAIGTTGNIIGGTAGGFASGTLVNTIGTQVEALKPGIGDYLFSAKEGSFLSQALNLVPGVNAVSSFHDNIVIKFDQDTFMRDWVMNAPTMPIAAMITYGALLDGPLATQFGVDRSR